MPVSIKIKRFTTASDVPTTSELTDGEIAVNVADKKIYVRDGSSIVEVANLSSGGSVDLSAVAQNIIPDANGTRNLGSATKRFAELFLAGETINLGGATISSDGTGTVSVSATGVTLPAGSKAGDNKIAVAVTGSGNVEQAAQVVDFFSKAGGLSSANTSFSFNATVDDKFVFTGSKRFTLANGNSLADSNVTLFQF